MELVNVFDAKMALQKNLNVADEVPNEILRPILAKFDVQFLISVRAVCKRWKVVIEDICDEKTTIVIESKYTDVYDYEDIASISDKLNGLVDFSVKCAVLTVKRPVQDSDRDELYKNLCLTLVKLFSRVETLAITSDFLHYFSKSQHLPHLLSQWSSTLVTLFMPTIGHVIIDQNPALVDAINKLTALRRLVFAGNIYHLLPATLAQLEHFSLNPYSMPRGSLPLCVRLTSLYLVMGTRPSDIAELARLNGQLGQQLTRLRILPDPEHDDDHQVISSACEHFASLQMLAINSSSSFSEVIAPLGTLAQLSNLSLKGVDIGRMDELARANLPTLNSVETFSLIQFEIGGYDFDEVDYFDGDIFCRALSRIMPSLVQLTIKYEEQHVRDAIVQNLHHFTNLRKHEIVSPHLRIQMG